MPKYRALKPLFVDGSLITAGEEFQSDLPPGKAWEPLDHDKPVKAAEKAPKAAPVENPIDKMDETEALELIATKGGKPPVKGGIEAIRAAAKRAAHPSGDA